MVSSQRTSDPVSHSSGQLSHTTFSNESSMDLLSAKMVPSDAQNHAEVPQRNTHGIRFSAVLEIPVKMRERWSHFLEDIVLVVGGCPERPLAQHFAYNVFQNASRNDVFRFFPIWAPKEVAGEHPRRTHEPLPRLLFHPGFLGKHPGDQGRQNNPRSTKMIPESILK